GQRAEHVRLAPSAEIAPISSVPSERVFCLRLAGKLARQFQRGKRGDCLAPFLCCYRNQRAAHAATPVAPTRWDSARFTSQSQACCAFEAAVNMARLSALRTRSHDWMYCA